MKLFSKYYKPAIEFAIHYRKFVVVSSTLVFAFSVYVLSRMGAEFLPTLEEGDFAFHSMLPEGSTIDMSARNNALVEKQLLKFPEVKEVVCKTGTSEIPTDPMAPYDTDVIIVLKEKNQWVTTKDYQELMDTMLNSLKENIPGVAFEATQPIEMRFNELMTGVRQDVAVKIFGENIDTLTRYAEKVAPLLNTVEGIQDPKVERTLGMPQISIHYDRIRVAQYGLSIDELNSIVRTAFAGEKVGSVYENERKFDLVVRLEKSKRSDIEDVKNLYIPLESGDQIPLKQVASIDYVLGTNQISREDAKRRIFIGFNVTGRDINSVVKELQQKLNDNIKLPAGYYFSFGGSFKNLEEAMQRLFIAVPVALLLIFVLLYFAFNSYREALLIYSAIPLSAIGGIFALWIRGMPFSISAGVGFIALFGVAVLNGIVLISTFNQMEKDGVDNIFERVRKGTMARLRPVLMTASVASLGFLPMAISTTAGAEVQRPLATVVIGGLISATALTLIALPALYIMFFRKKKTPFILTALVAIFIFFIPEAGAQNQEPKKWSLDSCIAVGLRNNPGVQSTLLKFEQQTKLKKTGFDLGKTGIFYENEDLNTNHPDDGIAKLGFSQTIDFPSVWFAKKEYYKQSSRIEEINYSLAQKQLVLEISRAYYSIRLTKEKQNLLLKQDSIFGELEKAASSRFKTGETSRLELLSAQAKRKEIQLSVQESQNDILIIQQELMKLMNSTFVVETIDTGNAKISMTLVSDTVLPSTHQLLEVSRQKITLAEYHKKTEIRKLFPDLTFRYFNQNWYGVDDGYYGYSFGIGIPLFFWAQQGNIQSAKLQEQIAQKNYESDVLQLNSDYMQIILEYKKNVSQLDYYEKTGNAYAEEILSSAGLAFRAGEIGFLEYAVLINQSNNIRINYLNALNNYNQSVIKIMFYTNN